MSGSGARVNGIGCSMIRHVLTALFHLPLRGARALREGQAMVKRAADERRKSPLCGDCQGLKPVGQPLCGSCQDVADRQTY